MGAVFISYRRGDSEGQARALSVELVRFLGKESVFMDVDSIDLGRDFRQVLHERLGSCDLMLALIGPDWLDAKDAAGNRRLDSPTDFVRQEIAAALKRNIPVTPVLVQGAQMPAQERLPEDIQDLVFRNGFELSHTRWESDVRELVTRLRLTKAEPNAPQTESVAPSGGRQRASADEAAAPRSKRGMVIGLTLAAVAVVVVALGMWKPTADTADTADTVPPEEQAVPDTGPSDEQALGDNAAGVDPDASVDEPQAQPEATNYSATTVPDRAATQPAQTYAARTNRAAQTYGAAAQTQAAASSVAVSPGFGTNGLRVSKVMFGDPRSGAVSGNFVQSGPSEWVETGASVDVVRFRFREVNRDEWSVYLEDESRNMTIQLDLYRQKVLLGEIGGDQRNMLYDIVNAS